MTKTLQKESDNVGLVIAFVCIVGLALNTLVNYKSIMETGIVRGLISTLFIVGFSVFATSHVNIGVDDIGLVSSYFRRKKRLNFSEINYVDYEGGSSHKVDFYKQKNSKPDLTLITQDTESVKWILNQIHSHAEISLSFSWESNHGLPPFAEIGSPFGESS